MKAYIILAHQQSAQLGRLLARLDDGDSYFFLHIDKKVPIQQFSSVIDRFKNKIHLVTRVSIEWGSFEMVKATLNAMYAIKDHPLQFSWIILLSGQDYPIKTNEYINNFLRNTYCGAFMEYTRLPDYNRWAPRGGYYRIDKYFMGFKKVKKLTAKGVNFLASYLPFLRRPVLKDFTHYAGSQWWMMNFRMLDLVLNFLKENPGYYSFHKYTFAADEVFFHSILMNAGEEIKNLVANDNKRYYNWPDTSRSHPEILQETDLLHIQKSDALFARKFDMAHHAGIMALIDQNCLNEKQYYPIYQHK